jgi:hypothetical protein
VQRGGIGRGAPGRRLGAPQDAEGFPQRHLRLVRAHAPRDALVRPRRGGAGAEGGGDAQPCAGEAGLARLMRQLLQQAGRGIGPDERVDAPQQRTGEQDHAAALEPGKKSS